MHCAATTTAIARHRPHVQLQKPSGPEAPDRLSLPSSCSARTIAQNPKDPFILRVCVPACKAVARSKAGYRV
eukprot:9655854-Alexandrium_andersonii.AAC.1